jgi:hypothetical protein
MIDSPIAFLHYKAHMGVAIGWNSVASLIVV